MKTQVFFKKIHIYHTNCLKNGGVFFLSFLAIIFQPSIEALAQKEEGVLIKELQQLYRIDLLPEYRKDSKVSLISTFDPTGGNDDGFSGKYSFVRKEGDNLVLADLKGPGVVHRIHSPTPTDKMLAFYFDGEKTPRIRLPFIELFSGKSHPFLKPLVGNEVGGYYCYVPIPYKKSLKIVYEGNDARFHQIQYRSYPKGTTMKSFNPVFADKEMLEMNKVAKTWDQIGKPYWLDGKPTAPIESIEQKFTLEPNGKITLFNKHEGGRILGIEIDRDNVQWGSKVLLEAYWDDEKTPAILSPADDFFGYSFGKVAAQGLLLGSFSGNDYCYMPMPFDKSASLTLRALPGMTNKVSGTARIYYSKAPRDPETEGKLYTVWRRETRPEIGKPYLLFETKGRGHHVGTMIQAQGLEPGTTVFFEGDDVKTIDGEVRWHGGGSEDYFNGGWYWILNRWDKGISLPIHGSLDYSLPFARTGGYRFYLNDKVPFEKEYHFTIEHGPEGNKSLVDYTSVCFYYGEQSSTSAIDPAMFSKAAYVPPIHEFDVRDFSMTIGSGTTANFKGYSSGMEISGEIPIKGFVVDDAERGEAKGQIRIYLSEMKSGRYKVLFSYDQFPEGGKFSIWRRQEQISDWIDTYSPDTKTVKGIPIGEIQLRDQVRSLTIRTKASDQGGNIFRIRKLILEEI